MAPARNRFTKRRQQLADLRRRRLRRVSHLVEEMLADLPAELSAARKTPAFKVIKIHVKKNSYDYELPS